MDKNQQGNLTESKIITYILSKGYFVSLPFGGKEKYDQIWDIDGNLYKIQIKTSHPYSKNKGDAIEFNTTGTSNGKTTYYTKADIDYFATIWNNQVYVVPVENTSSKKVLRFKSNSKQPNINWAKDYTFENIFNK